MSPSKATLVASAAVLALGLSACGDDTDAGAAATSPTTAATASSSSSMPAGTQDAGTMFAAMMVSHHQDGIELAQMAASKAATPGVKQIAQRSLQSQQEELPQLQAVVRSGGISAMPPEEPIQKFTQQQMARLQSLSGVAFDRLWLDTFSSHHMSAVMMSDTAMPASTGTARTLQQKIHDEQLKDISEMNTLRDKLGR